MSATLVAMLVSVTAFGVQDRDCRYSREVEATLSADGVEALVVMAASGSLEITGRAELAEIRVRGEVCASEEDLLDDARLHAEQRGDRPRIEVDIDDRDGWWDDDYVRLDLVVELPARLSVDVDDSSGSVRIANVAGVRLHDSSGSVEIEGVAGDVVLYDGSGWVEIRDVGGDVDLEDGSGSIDLADIDGDVRIDDGSGGIEVVRVGRSVRIDDGSGGIDVRDVGGDFVVYDDGSGGIRYRDVRGEVDIPR